MTSRDATTSRTRKRILNAAMQLFVHHGYHGTSMRRIARGAGVSLGNLYNHFEGKEALFTEVLFEFHPYHQILPALQSAQGERLEELVRDSARQLVAHLSSHPEFLNLMFIELVELDGRHMQALRNLALPEIRRMLEPLAQQAQGSRLRPISGALLLRAFIGLFVSYHITEILFMRSSGDSQAPHGLETFVDIFLHGVLEPEAEHGR